MPPGGTGKPRPRKPPTDLAGWLGRPGPAGSEGREGKGREGKGGEGTGRKKKRREGKGREGKGREGPSGSPTGLPLVSRLSAIIVR
jgi:hypothetical protein